MPFRGMGVTVTVYGSEIGTFKPVDRTGLCHSSVMVATGVRSQMETSQAGCFGSSSLRGGGVVYSTDEQAEIAGMQKLLDLGGTICLSDQTKHSC